MDPVHPSRNVRIPYRLLFLEHGQRRLADVQPFEAMRRAGHIFRVYADHGSCVSL